MRRQPDRVAHVVGEDQEARAERPQLGERHAVQGGAHRVLADAEVQVAAAVIVRLEVAGVVEGQPGLGGGRQVGRAADQPGEVLRDGVLDLARGIAAGDALRVGREGRDCLVPAGGQLARLHRLELRRQLGIALAVAGEQRAPLARALRRRAGRCRRRNAAYTPSGTRNCASSGQP